MRKRNRLMAWSASLRNTSVARGRVGRMFSIRLGRLMECQISRAAVAAARDIWRTINRPNLIENILPTRPRATAVLRKDADHAINRLRLRKI